MGFGPITKQRMSHMYGRELSIWDRFVFREGTRLSQLQYDVHLGTPREMPASTHPTDRILWESLTAKRVDVVCRWHGSLFLVEVKEIQSMSGLGQVLSYVALWDAERRADGPARPLVVCGRLDDDLRLVYERNNVEVVCV